MGHGVCGRLGKNTNHKTLVSHVLDDVGLCQAALQDVASCKHGPNRASCICVMRANVSMCNTTPAYAWRRIGCSRCVVPDSKSQLQKRRRLRLDPPEETREFESESGCVIPPRSSTAGCLSSRLTQPRRSTHPGRQLYLVVGFRCFGL